MESYILGKYLGEGAHSRVFLCEHKLTVCRFAVKMLEKKLLKKDMKNRYMKEIKMMHSFINPYIIHVHEYFEDDERIYIVMEYCAGGNMLSELNQRIKIYDRFTEKQVAWIMN